MIHRLCEKSKAGLVCSRICWSVTLAKHLKSQTQYFSLAFIQTNISTKIPQIYGLPSNPPLSGVTIKIPPIINNCEPFASSQWCDVRVGVDIADDLVKRTWLPCRSRSLPSARRLSSLRNSVNVVRVLAPYLFLKIREVINNKKIQWKLELTELWL